MKDERARVAPPSPGSAPGNRAESSCETRTRRTRVARHPQQKDDHNGRSAYLEMEKTSRKRPRGGES
jgi:hypothetical protein